MALSSTHQYRGVPPSSSRWCGRIGPRAAMPRPCLLRISPAPKAERLRGPDTASTPCMAAAGKPPGDPGLGQGRGHDAPRREGHLGVRPRVRLRGPGRRRRHPPQGHPALRGRAPRLLRGASLMQRVVCRPPWSSSSCAAVSPGTVWFASRFAPVCSLLCAWRATLPLPMRPGQAGGLFASSGSQKMLFLAVALTVCVNVYFLFYSSS
jgi:hypothetical protein